MKVSKLNSPLVIASLERGIRVTKQAHDDIRAVSIANGLINEGKARRLGAKGAETLTHKSKEQKAHLSALGITPSQLERESDYVAAYNAMLTLERFAAKYPANPTVAAEAPKETPKETPIEFASEAAAEFAAAESMTDSELRSITPKRQDGKISKGELVAALHTKRA